MHGHTAVHALVAGALRGAHREVGRPEEGGEGRNFGNGVGECFLDELLGHGRAEFEAGGDFRADLFVGGRAVGGAERFEAQS